MTHHVTALTPVPQSQRDAYIAMPATRATHHAAMEHVSAMREVESGGTTPAASPAQSIRIAAWNVERCLYPQACADMLRAHGVDVALLTEVDHGCHRTGQRHTTRDIAERLGHGYAYGLEFLELATMPQPIAFDDTRPGNDLGFHGNGLTSAIPFRDPIVIRLDEVADWWMEPKGGQRRVGSRMAVAAMFDVGGLRFVACSVHLESASDAPGRARQMTTLLDALDAYAAGLPVVIGGDLNVEVEAGRHDDPDELLFAETAARGYDWAQCNAGGPTTRPSTWSTGAGTRTLDWFCTRGLSASAPEIVPAITANGTVLSDHDLILVTLTAS